MTVRYVVMDFELTSRELAQAHVVEWAAAIVDPVWFSEGGALGFYGGLVKPPVQIPPETSAVHHIIDADVADAPPWELACLEIVDLLQDDPEAIVVGHTVDTERQILAPLNVKCRWLCTHKAAVRTWPDAPAFSKEALRYYLGFGTGRSKPQAPHSARHDVEVTARLLEELLLAGVVAQDMIDWTEQPTLLPRCPIGDYRGYKWADIADESFLYWILRRIHDRDDLRFCAQLEIDRREKEREKEREDETYDDDRPF